MKYAACVVAFLLSLVVALPAQAVPQSPTVADESANPGAAAGFSLLAALTNVVYFPARLALTVTTAEVGGFTGWMTGGDRRAAHAVWNVTAGQAFITPAMLEGREPLRFGPWPRGAQ